jgi:intracellular sulfur oxidation DsrE/DsrF family protein
VFGKPVGKDKSWACFVRRYDADHLARHPLQKVSAMKLLVSVEYPPEDKAYRYCFRLGLKYRDRKVTYDSAGDCGHVMSEDTGNEVRLGCGIDCDGGGLGVTLAKDDIENHLDGVGGPANVTIALVVHGPALRAFHSASANPHTASRVGQFAKARLELAACGNTMRSQNVVLKDLLPGFMSADKGGVVRISELQSLGYLYLRP